VDRDDAHVYQPGLLFVPFGRAEARRLTRPRWRQLHSGITYHQPWIDHVDVENDRVYLQNGNALDFDVLVVAAVAAWPGAWPADPVIALGIAAWSAPEGRQAWRGASCC
jgi:hypothetical protein